MSQIQVIQKVYDSSDEKKQEESKFSQICREIDEVMKDPLSGKKRITIIDEMVNNAVKSIQSLTVEKVASDVIDATVVAAVKDQVSEALINVLQNNGVGISVGLLIANIGGIAYATKMWYNIATTIQDVQKGGSLHKEFTKLETELNGVWTNGIALGENPSYLTLVKWFDKIQAICVKARTFRNKLEIKHQEALNDKNKFQLLAYLGALGAFIGIGGSVLTKSSQYTMVAVSGTVLAGVCYLGSQEAGKLLADLEELDDKIIDAINHISTYAKIYSTKNM